MAMVRHLVLFFFLSNNFSAFARDPLPVFYQPPAFANTKQQPAAKDIDTVVIRFDYKQSALFHPYTLEILDSVIRILLKDTAITMSIAGFAYKDEGSDTICYYLSLNRAMFIHTYVIGRGIDSSRIPSIKAYGKTLQKNTSKDKSGALINCRAELILTYPPPPPPKIILDKDGDGIDDQGDKCPDVFGYADNAGCPDTGTVVVPFPMQQSILAQISYQVLDSVVKVLSENPEQTITIAGNAGKAEGAYSFCQQLAGDRAMLVKNYLISRRIATSRIREIKNYGISRPLNTGGNAQEILKNARVEIRFHQDN